MGIIGPNQRTPKDAILLTSLLHDEEFMYDGNDEYLWQSIGLVVRVTSSISCHSQKREICMSRH